MPSSPVNRSVIIIGAGIFGVTAALELRRRGWRVTLLDPGPVPHSRASSTDISKVIRMDYGSDAVYTELMELALAGWEEWNRRWDEPLYHAAGFVVMTSEAMGPGGFEYESYQLLTARGHRLERLDAATLGRRFPTWNNERYVDGYFNPRAGWAASGRVVGRVAGEARALGADVREGVWTDRLVVQDTRVCGVEIGRGERLTADFVIVSAGAWTPLLLPGLDNRLSITGQPVLYLRVEDPATWQPPHFSCWAADIARTGWYGFPAMDDGVFKIGHHGPGVKITPDELREGISLEIPADHEPRCREFLAETFPALAAAPVAGSRLCLYCDSWDGAFYIDHDPDRPGLFVAAGGSGHGFKFAPVLGELIADRLEEKPNRYSKRFAWRARGEAARESARASDRR